MPLFEIGLAKLAEAVASYVTIAGRRSGRPQAPRCSTSFAFGRSRDIVDLPDLAALIAPRALLVVNGSRDSLFAPEGVRAAFDKIQACFRKAGAPDRQRCRLYDAPHEFNRQMQDEAFAWIAQGLGV